MSTEPSLAQVAEGILESVRDIVRLELKLARAEVRASLSTARNAVIVLAVGAVLIVLAAPFFLLAAVYTLSLVMPPWAAALTVAVVTAALGGLALILAVSKFKRVALPERTIQSLQEGVP